MIKINKSFNEPSAIELTQSRRIKIFSTPAATKLLLLPIQPNLTNQHEKSSIAVHVRDSQPSVARRTFRHDEPAMK